MLNLHALYVEDNDEQYFHYSKTFIRVLETDFAISVSLQRASDAEAGVSILRTAGRAFGIVIVDMLFPVPGRTQQEPLGLDVVRAASRLGNNVIVVLTQGDLNNNPTLNGDAHQAGADIFRYHSQLNGSGKWEHFCEEIYWALIEKEVIADALKLKLEDADPRLEYVVSQIGEMNLKRLYEDLFRTGRRPSEILASYVGQGLSGSLVLHVEGKCPGDLVQNHLMKACRDSEILFREVVNRPQGGYRGGLFIEYVQISEDGLMPRGGWYAIGAVFERGAKTLREWLSVKRPKTVVCNLMHSLFMDDGLARGYAQKLSEDLSVTDSLRLTVSRRARALMALKELETITSEVTAPHSTVVKTVSAFVRKGRVGALDPEELLGRTQLVRSHRDLHGANVLVRASRVPTIVIIDTAEVGNAHWAADYARLGVDLTMAAFQGADVYRFDSLDSWRALANCLIRRDFSKMPNLPSVGAITALRWMADSFYDVFEFLRGTPDRVQWEWSLALATEYVRAIYRIDLPAPKKVLAIVAAFDALEETHRAYRELS